MTSQNVLFDHEQQQQQFYYQQPANAADHLQFFNAPATGAYASSAPQAAPSSTTQQAPQSSSMMPQSFSNYFSTPGGATAFMSQPMMTSHQEHRAPYVGHPFGTGGYADEPPLLEELGINMQHIVDKSKQVLNVVSISHPSKHIMDDTDLAGPMVFCVLLGSFLLLNGKVHFGYIYGVAMIGCVTLWFILNCMSSQGVDGYRTASVLGYSLLPMVLLSGLGVVVSFQNLLGYAFGSLSIIWCTHSASSIFVSILDMKDQRVLVAYPLLLFYSAFALMTIF